MGRILILSFLFLLFFACNTQNINEETKISNDWIKMNLKGNVMKIQTETYDANLKSMEGGELKKIDTNDTKYYSEIEGFPKSIEFNKVGKKIKEELYYNGEILYEYDKSNNLIASYYTKYPERYNVKKTYKYNKNGTVEEENEYCEQEICYSVKKGNLTTKTKNYFDENNNIKRTESYNNSDEMISKIEYDYNKAQQVSRSERIHYIYSNSTREISLLLGSTYSYDDKNNISLEKYSFKVSALGKEEFTYFFFYSYDNKGNWIEKKMYNGNTPLFIIYRNISYF